MHNGLGEFLKLKAMEKGIELGMEKLKNSISQED